MKKDNLNSVRVTIEKQYDDRDYEVQGVMNLQPMYINTVYGHQMGTYSNF